MAQVAHEIGEAPAVPPGEAGGQIAGRSPWQLFWRRFKQDKLAIAGIVAIVFILLLATLAAPISKLVGHGPNDVFLRQETNEVGLPNGPDSNFWFGADTAGRD